MMYQNCTLCPRKCKVNRHKTYGICHSSDKLVAAKAQLHFWEEPCISGKNGSGTIFFSGCTLKCCFCQNHKISSENFGKEISAERLSNIFLELQEKGAENINLVTPTHFVPHIISALDMVKHKLYIPIVYNSGGYETIETLQLLEGYIDIYLPDLKYYSSELSEKYSKAEDYFEYASNAIIEMHRQQPKLIFNDGMLKKGIIIRHLLLPRCRHDSINIMKWLSENLPVDSFLISLMSQYTPNNKSDIFPELNRKITTFEYNSVVDVISELNLKGFTQEKTSASDQYIPEFDFSGI